jgi:hypothetical protein
MGLESIIKIVEILRFEVSFPIMRDRKELRLSVLDTESTTHLSSIANQTVDPESSSG